MISSAENEASRVRRSALLGVLGGMGPLATAQFVQRVVELTPASRDQDHLPMLVANLTHTPDRSSAIIDGGPDPLPALLDGIALLNRNEVDLIVVPCNSAHHWIDSMRASSAAPMLHIAEACIAAIRPEVERVGLLATGGTLVSAFYQTSLGASGFDPVVPDPESQAQVAQCIRHVKAGDINGASLALMRVLSMFIEQGVTTIIMGCTEIPLAAAPIEHWARSMGLNLVDSTLELAKATIAHATSQQWLQAVGHE